MMMSYPPSGYSGAATLAVTTVSYRKEEEEEAGREFRSLREEGG